MGRNFFDLFKRRILKTVEYVYMSGEIEIDWEVRDLIIDIILLFGI